MNLSVKAFFEKNFEQTFLKVMYTVLYHSSYGTVRRISTILEELD